MSTEPFDRIAFDIDQGTAQCIPSVTVTMTLNHLSEYIFLYLNRYQSRTGCYYCILYGVLDGMNIIYQSEFHYWCHILDSG